MPKYHAIQTYRGVEVQLHAFLISAVRGDEWSASRPGRFTLGDSLRCPLDRRMGGPESRSVRGCEEKKVHPYWESNPGRRVRSIITVASELPRTEFMKYTFIFFFFDTHLKFGGDLVCHPVNVVDET
jgi:hypothetical protein